ncbi:MAG: sugar nucleotide-binding protein [Candidatus Magasanikbacteria bacterium]|nr:sugar nucleotide-binding protein [Candidatus Magasanikbacteria bacterium]
MKILVIGANGFVAQRFHDAYPSETIAFTGRVTDKASFLEVLDQHQPDAVVNAAGRTGRPNVDWCESHQVETYEGNVIMPLVLASACQERSVYLLHLASGCIFYGDSPDPRGWREDDFANPTSFYSRTKYSADLVLSHLPNVGIARLRMPIDSRPHQRNLIDKLATYKQIVDVENSATVIEDLVRVIFELCQKKGEGVFHVVNPGTLRHRDLINLYQELVDASVQPEWINADDLVARGLAVKGRSNCILQSTRLQELGISMRPIDVALRDTMMKYAVYKLAQQPRQQQQTSTSFLRGPVPMQNTEPLMQTPSQPPKMKGAILAGGRGTRLAPLTNVTNKHLLPINNKQMVLYPLQTLLSAGIRDIIIVTGPDYAGHFMNLLGSGKQFGCNITYRIQDESAGIAHALALCEEFVGNDYVTVILGDNIFEDQFHTAISSFQGGAMGFYKPVHDPERFGVMEIDSTGRVLTIEEKPQQPRSNFAQVGLYVYDKHVFDIVRTLKPSARGELEITDVNNVYLQQGQLSARPVRGFWTDAGTFDSLKKASDFAAERGL